MAALRSPLLPLGIAGYQAPVVVPVPAFRSPLWVLGFSGYTTPPTVSPPGMRSVFGFWAGGLGGYTNTATEVGPTAIWRPIFRSGTRRR